MRVDKRVVAVVEMAVLSSGYFFVTWFLGPRVQSLWANATAFSLIVGGIAWFSWISPKYIHRDEGAERGFGSIRTAFVRTDNLGHAARDFGLLTLLTAILMVAAATQTNPHFLEKLTLGAFAIKICYYFCFALIQATFFFGFMSVRLGKLIANGGYPHALGFRSRATIILLIAAFFSLCHLPNPPLMAIAFAAAIVWGWLFAKRPNIVALAFTHAFLGTLLHKVVGLPMRFGPFYRDTESYMMTHLLPFLNNWKEIIYIP